MPSIKLYLSWYFAKQVYNIDVMFISYEGLLDNKFDILKKLCNYYEIEYNAKNVENSKQSKGSADKMLTEKQKEKIIETFKPYKGLDFSALGV